jgi:hypothetical protein
MNEGTSQVVYDQLQNDPNFVVDFAVDNNPEEVMARLSSLNLLPVPPQDVTKKVLKGAVRRIGDAETLREVLEVPYVNNASNYTGGLEAEFESNAYAKTGNGQQGVGLNLTSGILSIGSSVVSFLTSRNQLANTELQSEMTQAQLDAQQQMLLSQQEFERQQLEANRVLGIPLNAFIAVVGAMAVIFVVALIKSK